MWKATWKRFTLFIDQLEGERPNGRLFLLPRLPLVVGGHLAFIFGYSILMSLGVRALTLRHLVEMATQAGIGLVMIFGVVRLVSWHRQQWRGGALVDLLGTGLFCQGYALLGVIPDLMLSGPGKATPLGQFVTLYSWITFGLLGTALIMVGLTVFIRRYESERSERRRLSALIRFTEQLSQQDEKKLLAKAAEQLQELLEADSTVIYLWDDADEVLVPVASCFNERHDESYIAQTKAFRVPRNFGATGVVFETGRPHLTGNSQKDRYTQPLPGWGGEVKSGLFVPIGDEQPVGVVRMTRFGVDKFDRGDIALAASFARQVHLVLQHARALRDLADLSITDHLTGLYNARHLFSVLEREVERARRYSQPLSLIMLDADCLKQVNDRLGHQQGDEYLRTIGRLLKESLRSTDWAFRYAGDEFAIILPLTAASDASVLGERLRKIIAEKGTMPGLEPTFSVGVAAFPTHAQTVEALVGAADAALYASKRGGKNRLTIAAYQNVAVSQMPPEQDEGSPA
ncbi:MAG TPA: sensor domain-containing diguanylate cyclase [Symbiobacteriaceae bacterium]|nr:sensor domain-containing diguanylate cyclase [Symbiobacteriaceae bacterium]